MFCLLLTLSALKWFWDEALLYDYSHKLYVVAASHLGAQYGNN